MRATRALRILALATAAATAAACGTARAPAPFPGAPAGGPGSPAGTPGTPSGVSVAQTIRVRHEGRVRVVPLDTYAAIVALTELAPGNETPQTASALYRAQIVVARTYAVSRLGRHGAEGFDLCDATHCQRYEAARLRTARWAALAQQLARDTAADVLVHDGALVEAVFHADCGGHTASAIDVWRTARPYLVGRRDDLPAPRRGDGGTPPHREWTSTLARGDVEDALRRDRRTRVEGRLRAIEVARRDGSGRAARIRLEPERGTPVEVDGEVFRAAISAGLGIRALPSTRVTLEAVESGWRATGTGFGHGVGLCQAGALSRARAGASAAEILRFYYPGAIIERARAR